MILFTRRIEDGRQCQVELCAVRARTHGAGHAAIVPRRARRWDNLVVRARDGKALSPCGLPEPAQPNIRVDTIVLRFGHRDREENDRRRKREKTPHTVRHVCLRKKWRPARPARPRSAWLT